MISLNEAEHNHPDHSQVSPRDGNVIKQVEITHVSQLILSRYVLGPGSVICQTEIGEIEVRP